MDNALYCVEKYGTACVGPGCKGNSQRNVDRNMEYLKVEKGTKWLK